MQGGQPSQPSGTNRPGGLAFISSSNDCKAHISVTRRFVLQPSAEALIDTRTAIFPRPLPTGRHRERDRPVIMARGPHPFPFRTRSLSLAARMVLPGKPGGRVRHHRPHPENARLRTPKAGIFVSRLRSGTTTDDHDHDHDHERERTISISTTSAIATTSGNGRSRSRSRSRSIIPAAQRPDALRPTPNALRPTPYALRPTPNALSPDLTGDLDWQS